MQVMSFLLRIIIFCDSTTFKKFRVVFLFELQTLLFIDFSKNYEFRVWSHKTKTTRNFYVYCNLRKKYIFQIFFHKLKPKHEMEH